MSLSPDLERFDHTPPPEATAYWQEGMFLHFALSATESEIVGGFVYANRRPLLGRGQVYRSVALYHRDGRICYHASVVPLAAELDPLFHVTVPFAQVRIRAEGWPVRCAAHPSPNLTNLDWGAEQAIGLDLTFTASRAPFSFGTLARIGFIHYEQLGRLTGRLRLGEQEVTISEAHAARDHTLGTRRWTVLQDHWLVMADLPGGMLHLLCAQTDDARLVEGIMRRDRTGVVQRAVAVTAYKEHPERIISPARLTVTTDDGETHNLTFHRPHAFVMPVNPRSGLVQADAEMIAEITWTGGGERLTGIGYVEHLRTMDTPPGFAWPFPVLGDDTLEDIA